MGWNWVSYKDGLIISQLESWFLPHFTKEAEVWFCWKAVRKVNEMILWMTGSWRLVLTWRTQPLELPSEWVLEILDFMKNFSITEIGTSTFCSREPTFAKFWKSKNVGNFFRKLKELKPWFVWISNLIVLLYRDLSCLCNQLHQSMGHWTLNSFTESGKRKIRISVSVTLRVFNFFKGKYS